jgi:cytochrome c biogenesis protein CcmG/thiol:disulfide interchange protein DsbE
MKKAFIPLAIFLVLVGFLVAGLGRDPKELPSQFINKPAPLFSATQLLAPAGAPAFSPADMKGKVWILNVFASWCVACQVEHPVLMQMAKDGQFVLVGLNYKDKPEDALKWLSKHGNPYQLIATDPDGRIGIDYGVYGVPESYIIDKNGTIRDKIIGPITENILTDRVLPRLKEIAQ